MSNKRITPFLFGDITIRVIEENCRLAWVTVDVCRALGITNAADAVKDLDDDEKGIATIYTLGGQQKMGVLYESGLYGLIFKSRKPHAVRFRKWVTSEVLPTIRRTGSFVPTSTIPIDKSLEDTRISLAKVNTSYKVHNKACAAWVWEHEGLPMPPPNLLPGWWQGDLLR